MSLFILFFLAVNLLMAGVVLLALRRAGGRGRIFAFAVLCLASPSVGMPLLRLAGDPWLPWPLLRAGLLWCDTWLVLLFWLFCLHTVLAVVELAGRLVALGLPRLRPWLQPAPRVAVWLAWSLTLAAFLAGLREARRIDIRQVEVRSSRLAFDTPPLRVALLADAHIGPTSRRALPAEIAAALTALKPDLILSAGDLVDGGQPQVREALAPLAAVNAPLGKFAVTGNHEAYLGLERSLPLLQAAGFDLLRNTAQPVGAFWRVAGIDDPQAGLVQEGVSGAAAPEDWVLPRRRDLRYTILLKHRPEVAEAARTRAELQLSAHSHGGQVFPFGWIVRMLFPWPEGVLHRFPEGLDFYVSRGAGAWGTPLRLGARPEITLFIIRPEPTSGLEEPDPGQGRPPGGDTLAVGAQ